MPKPLHYEDGALIYRQGEDAEKVYILQNGKVSLVYEDVETGEDMRDQLQPGEFFGVKSALGRYSRQENAVVLSDASVMVFTIPEFEALVMANTRIIMKMLRVFSNQMRRIHAQVSNLLQKKEVKPDEGLFAIGEKYMKSRRYPHAIYIFKRYLELYPAGRGAAQAAKYLQNAEAGAANALKAKKETAAPQQGRKGN